MPKQQISTQSCNDINAHLKLFSGDQNGSHYITANGILFAWGDNSEGQLGNGSTSNLTTPTKITLPGTLSAFASGTSHACAIISSKLYCWGNNAVGQLGIGDLVSHNSPVQISTLNDVTAVFAGDYHTCAVDGGQLYCWGNNELGQLGLGDTTSRSAPAALAGMNNISMVAGGVFHTCALQSGVVKCWGNNSNGELGQGNTTSRNSPTAVTSLSHISWVAAGGYRSCAKDGSTGKLYCWGNNNAYSLTELGVGETPDYALSPLEIPGLQSLDMISMADHSSCAVLNKEAYCWGSNSDGQLGIGTTSTQGAPAKLSISNVCSVSIGGAGSACALTDSTLYCWGYNEDGAIGTGTTESSSSPQSVVAVSNFLTP